MAFKLDRCLTKELKLHEEQDMVVTDVKSTQTSVMDLSSIVVNLEKDGDVKYVQLLDRTVHDITVIGPDFIDPTHQDDPYAVPTQKGMLRLFFPKELETDSDGSALAREFVVKLTMQENTQVYFHEYSETMSNESPAPIIEYELDNAFLGNSMIHAFVETKKDGKNTFFMKSRNCVVSVKPKDKTSHGKWAVSYRSGSKIVTDVIKNYVDTDVAKIWYSGNDLEDLARPLIIFDKTKNYWIFSDKAGGVECVYVDASAKEFYLPLHAAHASWRA